MSLKILAIVVFVWVIAMFLGSTYEGHMAESTWAGTGSGGFSSDETSPISTMQYLLNVSNAVQRLPILGNIPIPVPNGEYFSTAYRVMTLQFHFITGDFGMFYWIFLFPFAL